jgi:hypothetical protein
MIYFVPRFQFRHSVVLILCLTACFALMVSGLSVASGSFKSKGMNPIATPFTPGTCGTCSGGSISCTGTIDATDPISTQRPGVLGNTSTCATPTSCPTPTASGTFRYDSYAFTNTSGFTECYTVTLDNTVGCAVALFSATYSPSFTPGVACSSSYLADIGFPVNVGSSLSYSFNAANGQSFEVVVMNRNTNQVCSGGNYTVTLTPCATVGGGPPPTTATKVVFTQQPTDTVVEQNITPAVTVQLQDNSSNNVTDPNIPITMTLTSGTGTLLGTTTQMTNASGLATFNDLHFNVTGAKQLTASSGSLTPATSNSFNITPSTPVPCNTCASGSISCSGQIVGHGTPATARKLVDGTPSTCANEACSGSSSGTFNYLTYTYRNNTASPVCYTVSFDNACNTAATSLFSAAYSPIFNPGNVCTNFLGDLGFATDTTTSYSFTVPSGQNFDIVVWNRNSGSFCPSPFTLTLTPCAALPPPTAATKVVFVQQPTNTIVDQTITPPVTVQLQDNSNSNVADANISITLALTSGTGTLLGTTTQLTDATGLATFNDLQVDVVGNNKQLTASSSGLIPAMSSFFNITPAAAVPCTTCASGSISCAGQRIGHGTPATTRPITDGVASTCANEACPGSISGTFNYLTYSFANNSGSSQCFTVSFDNACNTGTNNLFSAAYSPSFDSSNVCTNFLGDLGDGTNAVTTYSFTVANGQSFDVVVWNRVSNSYCASPFTFTLTPCTCPMISGSVSGGGTICSGSPSTVTVTLSGGVAPYTVTLDNGGGTLTASSPIDFTVSPATTTTYSVASATDSNGCPATVSGSATVTVNQPPTASNAGPDQSVCGTTATLAGNTPTVGTGAWSLVSGTGTITSPSSPTTTVTGLGVGPNVFRWTITNSPCPNSTDDVTITRDATPPAILCPDDVSATAAPGQSSATVTYPNPAATDNCPGVTTACSPPSGSSFPLGTTTVACTATDTSNNQANCTFTVTVSGSLLVNADSFLRDGADNTNEGANDLLRIQSAGHNRVVVRFNLSGISIVGLQSATLVLNITDNSDNWGPAGRLVDAHRLLADWTEGNGSQPTFRGTGEGVTWNCAKDSNITNQNDDCTSQWNGGTFAAATAAPVLHTNGQMGDVSWNVRLDVLAGAGNGWVIKKQNEAQAGQVKYYSKEGAAVAGNPNLGPRLVLVYAAP